MIFVPGISTPSEERRGIVLLVVIALLTLFASVGLSFVFYAEAESTAASYNTDAARKNLPDVEPELLLAYFLGQLIYDVDDSNGVYSALRGHSLARTMYGFYNSSIPPNPPLIPAPNNMNPYNGMGRRHTGVSGIGYQNNLTTDDYLAPNYIYFNNYWDPGLVKSVSDGFLRSPEIYPDGTGKTYYVGCNVSYTYPDLNNLFLAAVNGNGEVLAPSFFRPWTGIGTLDPSNSNWMVQGGGFAGTGWTKYLTLRPLPAYNPNFPPPEDGGGDVKNFPFGPGTLVPGTGVNTGVAAKYYNNDSIWIDLGFPVQIAPNGQKFKPMFAALIIDLDGKVNLNVHGNNRGGGAAGAATVHVSNQGWGQGEVNLSQVLTAADWVNILKGNGPIFGRYGKDGLPASGGILSPGPASTAIPQYWTLIDLDGVAEPAAGAVYSSAVKYSLSTKIYYPGETGNPTAQGYFGFPTYDTLSFASGDTFERTNNWMIYNSLKAVGDDTPFRWSEMEAMLRYGDTGSPALSSSLFALSPSNFAVARARRLVTTHSFDVGRPGLTPWLYSGSAVYSGSPGAGAAVGFPAAFPAAAKGEFGADYRGIAGDLVVPMDFTSKLSLNRYLPDYPVPQANGRYLLFGAGKQEAAFLTAQTARQQFANDIFNRLCFVTTGGWINPVTATGTTISYWYVPGAGAPGTDISTLPVAQYASFQWLAQLAVNIVDYIDSDTYITPFNWDTSTPNDPAASPAKWVYGTEVPRVVINEAYVEVNNQAGDMAGPKSLMPYQVNVWAELLCPLPAVDGAGNAAAAEALHMPAQGKKGGGANAAYPVYRLAIQSAAAATFSNTTLGTPTAPVTEVTNFSLAGVPLNIAPVGTNFSGPAAGNSGFFVVGPAAPVVFPGFAPPTPSFQSASMSYNTLLNTTLPAAYPKHSLILRRLACPALPPNPNLAGVFNAKLPYNPYVTVDYIQNVQPNDGVIFDAVAAHTPTPFAGNIGGVNQYRYAAGRNQPYAAAQMFNVAATPGGPPAGKPVQKLFGGGAKGTPVTIISANHGFVAGDKIFITGIKGDTAVNNDFGGTTPTTWTVTAPIKPNSFKLDVASVKISNGKYAGGGTIYFADRPQNTFFRHNSVEGAITPTPAAAPVAPFFSAVQGQTLKLPFDWLPHLDRYLISPMELLNVSAFPPYQLTQQFMTPPVPSPAGQAPPAAQMFQHLAPWSNSASRLYRFFEHVSINNRATGVSNGGRIPGQININSIWDVETFKALCDQQAGLSTFSAADVTTIFNALYASRSPTNGIPGPVGKAGVTNDQPFRSFATGLVLPGDPQNPQGLSIGDTLLRPTSVAGLGPALFDVPAASVTASNRSTNPVLVKELLNKIYANLTTRSNTFAVFLTVGFFEVEKDTDAAGAPLWPPMLGKEIGKAEGRNIRHRMFALIDRSELRVIDLDSTGTPITGTVAGGITVTSAPVTATVTISATTGPSGSGAGNGGSWTLSAGMALEVDTGTGNEETVVVQAVAGNTFTATFYKSHGAGGAAFPIVGRGNPGPWPRYNPRNDARVVPYFSIIE